jgi:hypothetical protein
MFGGRALVIVEDDTLDLDAADGGLLMGCLEGAYLADGVGQLAHLSRCSRRSHRRRTAS